ncbi:MAG TPA: Ig-like domain-containing protein [Ktedonobacterales bacterium]|nr:Ig-like domain-containing protein [Ktedonobacterales bacterium]
MTGDFQTLGATQRLRVAALGTDGQPLAKAQVALTIAGANARNATVTADGNGSATYTYTGANAGTDTISVALAPASGSGAAVAIIHWLQPQQVVHPIIWVHGINDDASVYRHGIAHDDLGVLTQHPEGTELFEALETVYDRHYIEAFCYIDDRAYRTSSPGCPAPEAPTCVTGDPNNDCISQSSVDGNAVELAKTVSNLSAHAGGKRVTLMSYSMGAAITRTLLAGCLNSPSADAAACAAAVPLIDHAFFLNGAQQGSWLMAAKAGWDPSQLAGQGTSTGSASAFSLMLPLLEQSAYLAVKGTLGIDANHAAEQDLTPQSANIVAHNSVPPPFATDYYNFYGDIEVQADINIYTYTLNGTRTLSLGDLVMLPQDDAAQAVPLWGGAALCDGCPTPPAPYREAGQYHAWMLTTRHEINLSGLAPLLNAPDAISSFTSAINSPVMHLNITQPIALAPGSSVQVRDITGQAGTADTDIPYEILSILMQKDGIV